VGGYAHFNIETLDIARQCGYEIGFSFQTGINLLGQINRYDIHRIPGDLELSMMCAALSLPSVFAQRKSDPSGPLPVRDF
jgi:hypothetical protein